MTVAYDIIRKTALINHSPPQKNTFLKNLKLIPYHKFSQMNT